MEAIGVFMSKYTWIILYVSALSILGGVTSYIRKTKDGTITRFSFSELVGDIVISFFIGVVTYLICKGLNVNDILTAGCIGISSHMGTRSIVFLEELIPKIVCKYFNVDCKK
jgi:hypothetical protein